MRGKGFNYRGFTLVELLVTISILSILMTIAIISYGNVQKNARDNKRKADLATIQSALEQYHADQGFYPASISFTANSPLTNGTKTYMSAIPIETQSGIAQYVYAKYPGTCANTVSDPSTYCTNYCLYAKMENSSNSVTAAKCSLVTPAPPAATYQTQAP